MDRFTQPNTPFAILAELSPQTVHARHVVKAPKAIVTLNYTKSNSTKGKKNVNGVVSPTFGAISIVTI